MTDMSFQEAVREKLIASGQFDIHPVSGALIYKGQSNEPPKNTDEPHTPCKYDTWTHLTAQPPTNKPTRK